MPENSKLSALGARLLSDAENISEEMQDWRRDFHQFPELAFEENITASKIIKVLASIEGMEVVSGFAIPTAVIGILRSDLPGPAIMLRSCMDAIAVEEETGLPFSSCMPGLMHGCGHDAHMASLLGAAKVLSLHRDKLKKRVVLLFQPAGEGRGGARTLVENRFLETFNIGSAASLHWWSELPYGELFLRRGVLTALSDKIHIDIRGTAGHAAEPHMTVDPVTIASHIVIAIQTMLTREIDPREPVVVSFGHIEAGFAYNVIPEQVNVWGTLRAFPKPGFRPGRIESMAPAIAKLQGTGFCRIHEKLRTGGQRLRDGRQDPCRGHSVLRRGRYQMLERPLLSGKIFPSSVPVYPQSLC